jgi:hypothetical protein
MDVGGWVGGCGYGVMILFSHSSADGYLGCVQFWAIMNSVVVNIFI